MLGQHVDVTAARDAEAEPAEERFATREMFASKHWLFTYLLVIAIGAVLGWFSRH
jgi:hypothetical protein